MLINTEGSRKFMQLQKINKTQNTYYKVGGGRYRLMKRKPANGYRSINFGIINHGAKVIKCELEMQSCLLPKKRKPTNQINE